eukprot:COSAG02_NODE_876_length_16272_cov_138.802510_3_plen_66_part_00
MRKSHQKKKMNLSTACSMVRVPASLVPNNFMQVQNCTQCTSEHGVGVRVPMIVCACRSWVYWDCF